MKEFEKGFLFRPAVREDLETLWEIEGLCFPAKEMVEKENFAQRLAQCPEQFIMACEKESGQVCGFISGIRAAEPELTDDMFSGAVHHDPEGRYSMILGLNVRPEYRKHGLASNLMEQWLRRGREEGLISCILTCHEHLLGYYRKFGFEDQGVSGSVWGGEVWYDMVCPF